MLYKTSCSTLQVDVYKYHIYINHFLSQINKILCSKFCLFQQLAYFLLKVARDILCLFIKVTVAKGCVFGTLYLEYPQLPFSMNAFNSLLIWSYTNFGGKLSDKKAHFST